MLTNWPHSLPLLLVSEGAEVNINPPGTPPGQGEPGGASKYGVSVAAYSDLRKRRGLPPATVQDIADLTEDQASDFYQTVTGAACRFNDMPVGVDYRNLDIFANLGPTGGSRLLCVALGIWPLVDTVTDAVIREVTRVDPEVLIFALGAAWLSKKHEQGVEGWIKSGHGWTNRRVRVDQDATDMSKGAR